MGSDDSNIRHATRREPTLQGKATDNKRKRSRKRSSKKINIILKNTVGPDPQEKKVRIPENAPISLLKEKIGQLYGLDPADFKLSHVPGTKGEPSILKVKQTNKEVGSTTKKVAARAKVGSKKQPVRIVLRSVQGTEAFQKKVNIPETITIGKLRKKVAEKFGLSPDEFELNLVRET